MSKTVKRFISFAVLILLTSCNPNNTFDDASASRLANEILLRQQEESFKLPNKFSFKSNTNQKIDCNFKSNEIFYDISKETIYECDLDNLIYRTYYKKAYVVPSAGTTTKEVITYFDEDKNLLYTVTVINESKTVTSKEMNKEEATTAITTFRDSYKKNLTESNNNFLTNFDSYLNSYKIYHDKLKDKEDEYFNYSFKSNDSKSLEKYTEGKVKQEKEYQGDVMKGYITTKSSYVIKDDLLQSISFIGDSDIKTSDNVYYNKQTISNLTSYNYIDVKIDRPTIN